MAGTPALSSSKPTGLPFGSNSVPNSFVGVAGRAVHQGSCGDAPSVSGDRQRSRSPSGRELSTSE
jgi:hypothetical protein